MRLHLPRPPTSPLDVLVACLTRAHTPSTTRFAQQPGFPSSNPRDRAFVRMVLSTTLRPLGESTAVLGSLIERPLDDARNVALHIRCGLARPSSCSSPTRPTPPSQPPCGLVYSGRAPRT